MARKFASTQYLSFGDGTFGALLNGAAYVSGHMRVKFDTIQALANSNFALIVVINGTASGLIFNVTAAGKLAVTARSVSTDAAATATGATTLSTGVWYSLGFVLDIAADDAFVYVDGVQDGSNTACGWANATYTQGTVTAGAFDRIGHPTAANSLLATVADFGLWTSDMRARMPDLADGYAASEVGSPIAHLELFGRASPEPDMRGNAPGTISGATQADHPRTIYPSRRSTHYFPPYAARESGLLVPRDRVEAA